MIEEYLGELGRLLPSTRRTRFLREAESHLRDRANALIAAGETVPEAERKAVELFGPVAVVAQAFAAAAAVHAVRRGTVLAVAALAALVVPLYLVPENTFGPAQWAAKPDSVAVTQLVALVAWLASLALGAVAVVALLADRPRAAATLVTGAVAAGLTTGVAMLVAGAVWLDHAPWTPLWATLGLMLPATAVLLGTAAVALAWVRARRPLLVSD